MLLKDYVNNMSSIINELSCGEQASAYKFNKLTKKGLGYLSLEDINYILSSPEFSSTTNEIRKIALTNFVEWAVSPVCKNISQKPIITAENIHTLKRILRQKGAFYYVQIMALEKYISASDFCAYNSFSNLAKFDKSKKNQNLKNENKINRLLSMSLLLPKISKNKKSKHRNISLAIPFPLHYAAANGYYDAFVSLLRNGFSLLKQDTKGLTPLHHAAINNRKEIVKYFYDTLWKDFTYIFYIKDKKNMTPVDYICAKLNLPVYSPTKKKRKKRKKRSKKLRQKKKGTQSCINLPTLPPLIF